MAESTLICSSTGDIYSTRTIRPYQKYFRYSWYLQAPKCITLISLKIIIADIHWAVVEVSGSFKLCRVLIVNYRLTSDFLYIYVSVNLTRTLPYLLSQTSERTLAVDVWKIMQRSSQGHSHKTWELGSSTWHRRQFSTPTHAALFRWLNSGLAHPNIWPAQAACIFFS